MISKIKNWTQDHHEQIVLGSVYAAAAALVVGVAIYAKKAEDKAIAQAHERGDLVIRSSTGDLMFFPNEVR